jgi:hypothetical protein
MSKEDFGVLSEYVLLAWSEVSEKVIDFRRAGGKKPRVLRGMRRISTGSGVLGIRTQDSCLYEVVSCDEVSESERDRGSGELWTSNRARDGSCKSLFVAVDALLSDSRRSKFSWASSTFLPRTPQASTGRKTCVRICILSLGQNLLTLRNTAC